MVDYNVFKLSTVLAFGKHSGDSLADVIEDDSEYVEWCIEKGIFKIDEQAQNMLNVYIEKER